MKNKQRQNPPSLQAAHTREIIYKGPIPPPAVMEQMEKLLPGAADRIFTMAEKDQNAEIEAKKDANLRIEQFEKDSHKEKIMALWMAFKVCIGFVCAGTILVLYGYEKIGASLLGTTLLGIVGSFLNFKLKQ